MLLPDKTMNQTGCDIRISLSTHRNSKCIRVYFSNKSYNSLGSKICFDIRGDKLVFIPNIDGYSISKIKGKDQATMMIKKYTDDLSLFVGDYKMQTDGNEFFIRRN